MTATKAKPARRANTGTGSAFPKSGNRRPKAVKPSESAASAPAGAKAPSGKLGIVVNLLRRPEGATIAQLVEATGWQAHSVRGALAGSLKRKHGLTIVGEPGDGGRVYRIATDQPA